MNRNNNPRDRVRRSEPWHDLVEYAGGQRRCGVRARATSRGQIAIGSSLAGVLRAGLPAIVGVATVAVAQGKFSATQESP